MECGCKVKYEREPGTYRGHSAIEFCPLHAAAPALLAALKEAWPYVPEHHGPIQHKIKEAIAQAERAEVES